MDPKFQRREARRGLPVWPGVPAPAGDSIARLNAGGELHATRGPLSAILQLLRPKQWIKNLLVIAAAGAAGALGRDDVPYRVTAAFFAFCLLASGIYAVNDARDADEDRHHPRKRLRPVAAGEISTGAALRLGAALMMAGVVLCYVIRPELAMVGGAYLVLMVSYTMLWRYVLIADVLAISGGFVLRAVAGGVAAPVALSRWFVVVVSAAAIFIATAKRYSELRRVQSDDGVSRRVVRRYSPRLLQRMMVASAGLAVFAYSVWAFSLPVAGGFPWRPLTLVPFVLGLLRYAARVRAGSAEAPEDLVLGDRQLLLAGSAWLILFALGVNAAG